MSAALVCVVLLPSGVDAQTPTSEPGVTITLVPPTTTVATTTTRAPTTTVAPATSAPPPTAPPSEEELDPAETPTTVRRLTTTTLRPTTTTVRATTSTSTSTTIAAVAVPTTSRPAIVTSSTLKPNEAKGNETQRKVDRVVRYLLSIAGITFLLGLVYAWHTSPRRRVGLAERKALRASQRLDDAVAASFVGTTLGFAAAQAAQVAQGGAPTVAMAVPGRDTTDRDDDLGEDDLDHGLVDDGLDDDVADDDPADGGRRGEDEFDDDDFDDAGDESREGLAAKLFPRREDADSADRPNPRPDPRPRPNDTPWTE